jgi:hypothetical protein
MADPETNLDEAFSLVANETRFDILQSLWAADAEALSFSSLHDRVDIRDSGQFNYHLGKLIPEFVREVEDGYELTYAGFRVIGAATSGAYTDVDTTSVDPIEVEDCPECDGTIEASYGDGRLSVECTDCDVTVTNLPAPPIVAAEHDAEELPGAINRYLLHDVRRMNDGFCTLCNGCIEQSVTELSRNEDVIGGDRIDITAACRSCGMETHSVVGSTVIDHPAVVAFLHDNGIDLRKTPVWELDWLFDPHATIESEDPVRVAVAVEYGDDAIELTLDGDLDVVEYERG